MARAIHDLNSRRERVLVKVNCAALGQRHILGALSRCGWKARGPGGAAETLGLKESSLRTQMKRLGIRRPADQRLGR